MITQHGLSARARWSQLESERTNFYDRCREYSRLTLPRLIVEEGYTQETVQLNQDWQSTGAIAVNYLVNVLAMNLFNPRAPFFKLEPSSAAKRQLEAIGITESDLRQTLSIGEQDALRVLEKSNARVRLFDVLRHLVVTGNALMWLGKTKLKGSGNKPHVRVYGMDKYVVKRSVDGDVLEIVVRHPTTFMQLDEEIRNALPRKYQDQQKVTKYEWIKLDSSGDYVQTTWIEDELLPKKFGGSWPQRKCPWHVLAWKLSSGADYGTGHVEDYASALTALSELSRSLVEGALQSAEFRWLVAPGSVTSIEDVMDSQSGDFISGNQGDITVLQPENAPALQIIQANMAMYEAQINRGFLMNTVRDAERVTAEEIRRNAMELEKGLGGVYSQIAESLQLPIAFWLIEMLDGIQIEGKDLEPVIITGIDALSRNSEVENIKLAIAEAVQVTTLPPQVLQLMRVDQILKDIGAGRGVDLSKYMKSPEQIEALQNAQYEQQLAMANLPPEQLPGSGVRPPQQPQQTQG